MRTTSSCCICCSSHNTNGRRYCVRSRSTRWYGCEWSWGLLLLFSFSIVHLHGFLMIPRLQVFHISFFLQNCLRFEETPIIVVQGFPSTANHRGKLAKGYLTMSLAMRALVGLSVTRRPTDFQYTCARQGQRKVVCPRQNPLAFIVEKELVGRQRRCEFLMRTLFLADRRRMQATKEISS